MPNTKAKAKKRRQKGNAKIETMLNSLMSVCNTAPSTTTEAIAKLSQLHSRLSTLSSLQPASSIIPRRTEESLERLVSTYTPDAGFRACFTEPNSNATLVAKRAVSGVIVRIPVSAAITDTLPECLSVLQESLPIARDASLRLTLNLLHHSSLENTPHRAYIDALPAHFDNLLSYPSAVVARLPDVLVSTAERVFCTHVRVYCAVLAALFRARHEFVDTFTWVNYKWASGVVMSRQNAVGGGLTLVPVWDMTDHDPSARGSEVVGEGEVEFVVLRGCVQTGERIRMNYGKRGNAELFLYAGFVVRGNVEDEVDVCFRLDGALGRVKGNLLRKLGVKVVEDPGLMVVVKARYGGFEEVMKVLRVVVMRKDGLVDVMTKGLPSVVGREVEDDAKVLLESVVKDCLRKYDDLLEGDVDERVSVLVNGEKAVLLDLLSNINGEEK